MKYKVNVWRYFYIESPWRISEEKPLRFPERFLMEIFRGIPRRIYNESLKKVIPNIS